MREKILVDLEQAHDTMLSDPFMQLCDDLRQTIVCREPRPTSAVAFHREYVLRSRPVVLTGMMHSGEGKPWPALSLWRHDADLATRVGDDNPVVVAVTPSGWADAVTTINDERYDNQVRQVFAMPHEVRMPLSQLFLQLARQDGAPPPITSFDSSACAAPRVYAQGQNSSFTAEYSALADDVGDEVRQLGDEVFGGAPEAVNMWIGNRATATAMHQDHYENLYAVVRGTKTFTLIPPWQRPLLGVREFVVAKYTLGGAADINAIDDVHFGIEVDEAVATPWVGIDPLEAADHARNRDCTHFHRATVLTVTVRAGEVLYLPAQWYHAVQQHGDCDGGAGVVIAVNYWWDMQFGPTSALNEFVEHNAFAS
jgi:jumonji domain-containing protein 7